MRYIELDRRREAIISQQANTYIGGVASTINTRSALATKLGINTGDISYFEVVGNNIKANIISNYTIPASTFYDNYDLTYYLDNSNKVTNIGSDGFRNAKNCKQFKFNGITTLSGNYNFRCDATPQISTIISLANCTSITGQSFYGADNFVYKLYIPKVTTLGADTANNNVLYGAPAGGKRLYINTFLQTANAGAEEGDIAYIRGRGATINYVANYTAPSAITDLAHNASILTFSTPSSTNAIDFYEVFVNGVYKQEITGSGSTVSGLVTGDKVTVYTCDIYYNKSISNEITI
jgi:hypothetical protein